jgi:uncharacterized lipoprotein YmbA
MTPILFNFSLPLPSSRCMRWLQACSALTLAACTAVPIEHFHTLQPLSPSTLTAPLSANFTVAVSPVAVSAGLDRPNWVIRSSTTELRILEQHRWAQPLSSEITEAIARLLNQRPLNAGLAYAETHSVTPTYPRKPTVRVQLEVLRFDTWLAPTPHVDDQLQWTVSCTGRLADGQQRLQRTGIFTTAPPTLPPAAAQASTESPAIAYEQLASAHAAALGLVSQDLAAAIDALSAQCPKIP